MDLPSLKKIIGDVLQDGDVSGCVLIKRIIGKGSAKGFKKTAMRCRLKMHIPAPPKNQAARLKEAIMTSHRIERGLYDFRQYRLHKDIPPSSSILMLRWPQLSILVSRGRIGPGKIILKRPTKTNRQSINSY